MPWLSRQSTSSLALPNAFADYIVRFDLSLEERLEYLTLAVGNAKSHPVSAMGAHEAAVSFLTDLEEKLEVAQVQLETYHTVLPHASGSDVAKVKLLSKKLFNITEVCTTVFL